MKRWQKAFVMNVAILFGIVSSLFVLPAKTPFFLWLAIAALVLVALNIAMVVQDRKNTSESRPIGTKAATIAIMVGAALWILDILVHVLGR